MNAFAALETPLAPVPEFFVEPPDGRKDWAEIDRQATFFQLLRYAAPRVEAYPNANAGKRNPRLAKKEGIRAGVFDITVAFKPPLVAWIELKGYDRRGKPGSLSDNQVEFGNRMMTLGHPVACFFDPHKAVAWLRETGFPVGRV